jgi:hypothetical protein
LAKRGTTHILLFLGEFATIFENILEHESGIWMGLFDEKTRGKQSSDTVSLSHSAWQQSITSTMPF